MSNDGNTWVVVLAAGEGARLRPLTTTSSGVGIPKQFCSLNGGASLLQEALQRADAITAPEFVCCIVAAQHQRWWRSQLQSLQATNVIVQSHNRGTANGILLPLLEIMERDAAARIVLLPSDHHVRDEVVLASALSKAVNESSRYPTELLMLGISPEKVDPDLGYIIPGRADRRGLCTVRRFVEKPSIEYARQLIHGGALWNAFIVAATARALLEFFERRHPSAVSAMRSTLRAHRRRLLGGSDTANFYRDLTTLDFSRHVVERQERYLRVRRVPACGWSDLGTPHRVAQAVSQIEHQVRREPMSSARLANLSLAAQCRKLGLAG